MATLKSVFTRSRVLGKCAHRVEIWLTPCIVTNSPGGWCDFLVIPGNETLVGLRFSSVFSRERCLWNAANMHLMLVSRITETWICRIEPLNPLAHQQSHFVAWLGRHSAALLPHRRPCTEGSAIGCGKLGVGRHDCRSRNALCIAGEQELQDDCGMFISRLFFF